MSSMDPKKCSHRVFYRSLPSSWGHKNVNVSVIVSMVISGVVVAVGFALLAAAVYGYTKAAGVGLFLTLCAALTVPLLLPAGIGGILTAVRFERLPSSWRRPGREDNVDLTQSP